MKTYTIPPACLAHSDWGIDPRHAQLLYNILLIPQIRTYLEIGCGYGVSTSAAVATIKHRTMKIDLCDVDPRPELAEILPKNYSHGSFFATTGVDVLSCAGIWDCVFIDGDHSPANVAAEIKELRRLDVPTIIAHDTCNEQYLGPRQFIQAYADYESIHDERFRGLFIASRDHVVMEQIRWAYAEYEQWLQKSLQPTV